MKNYNLKIEKLKNSLNQKMFEYFFWKNENSLQILNFAKPKQKFIKKSKENFFKQKKKIFKTKKKNFRIEKKNIFLLQKKIN